MLSLDATQLRTAIQPLVALATTTETSGDLPHYPRFEALHRLLAGRFQGSDPVHVVENGPLVIYDTSVHLARQGCRVTVKEPEADALRYLELGYQQHLTPAQRELIELRTITSGSAEAVHEVTPAQIVYWPYPNLNSFDPSNLAMTGGRFFRHGSFLMPNTDSRIEDYLGRDVVQGGFLVIQTDFALMDFACFNRAGPHARINWELVYYGDMDVLPGNRYGRNNLFVLRHETQDIRDIKKKGV